ncbi:hypothetical protein RRG08_020639 [Elysia crispata]|uniref:Secreted protein n=1 Tax=Elysia crispata TaxID=231223 RepID=A0AAE0YJL9_9GAST|nr:hypothetical protein RRG08_020639 [Elysia crispata]
MGVAALIASLLFVVSVRVAASEEQMFPGLSENVSENLSSKVSKLEDRNLRTPAAQVSCRCSKRQSVIGRSGRKSGTIGIVRRKFTISAKG